MREITCEEDRMRRVRRFELGDGRRVAVYTELVERFGLAEVARSHGVTLDGGEARLPVLQCGRRVGSLPALFDPDGIRSTSWLYEPRPGDFRRDGEVWVAGRMLGPGDLEAVPGFRRD